MEELTPNTTLSHYRIVSKLGAGGMGKFTWPRTHQNWDRQFVGTDEIAAVYIALGEKDKAFEELEKAYISRDWGIARLSVDPFVDPLRDDPRFKDLVKRMQLPE